MHFSWGIKMKLTAYELMKIFKKTLILIIIPLLMLINVFLYYQQEIKYNEYIVYNIEEYYELEEMYRNMPLDESLDEISSKIKILEDFSLLTIENIEALPFFQDTIDEIKENNPELIEELENSPYADNRDLLTRDIILHKELYDQLVPLTKYGDYVDGIQGRADEMLSVSIFRQEGTFSYRNIIKTPKDFEHLKDIPLKLGLDKGIVSATQFPTTDILIIIIIFLICVYLFLQEKESGLTRLIRTNKKGRFNIAVAKLITLISLTGALALIFYGSIILMGNYLYGFGDLSRYIQSMESFKHSNLLLTVGQYITLFLVGKLAVCILMALIFSLFFTLINNASKIYLCVAVLLGYSYISHVFIHSLSHVSLLKYINIIYFYNTYSLLGEYRNINFFGYPINNLYLAAILTGILFIVLPVFSVIIYVKNNAAISNSVFHGLKDKLKLNKIKLGQSIKPINHELFKAFVTGKGYIIILIALIIGYNSIYFEELRFNEDDAYYNSYLAVLSGKLDEERVNFVEEENERFERLPEEFANVYNSYQEDEITLQEYNQKTSELEAFALKGKAFQNVYDYYQYLLEIKETKGLEVGFVNKISSDYIFDNKSRDIINGILYTVLLILCLCVIFPNDYKNNMIAILKCTKNGRFRLFACKHAVAYIIAFILMVIIYLPQYINLIKNYNVENWNVPIQSIMMFRNFNIPVSVVTFIILNILIQFLGILIMANCILFLSLIIKRHSLAILAASAVFVCPMLIQWAGLDFIRRYSFNNIYLMFTEFSMSSSIWSTVLYYTVLILLGVCISILCWNKYNHNLLDLGVKKR